MNERVLDREPPPPKKFSPGMWTAIVLELLMILNLCTTLPGHATRYVGLGLALAYARFSATYAALADRMAE